MNVSDDGYPPPPVPRDQRPAHEEDEELTGEPTQAISVVGDGQGNPSLADDTGPMSQITDEIAGTPDIPAFSAGPVSDNAQQSLPNQVPEGGADGSTDGGVASPTVEGDGGDGGEGASLIPPLAQPSQPFGGQPVGNQSAEGQPGGQPAATPPFGGAHPMPTQPVEGAQPFGAQPTGGAPGFATPDHAPNHFGGMGTDQHQAVPAQPQSFFSGAPSQEHAVVDPMVGGSTADQPLGGQPLADPSVAGLSFPERLAVRTGQVPPQTRPRQSSGRGLLIAAAGVVLLGGFLAFGWLFGGSGDDPQTTAATAAAGTDGDATTATTELAPLAPAALPKADEAGLVGMQVPLIDVYTGTGSTGSVELYLNTVTGEVCHVFDAAAFSGRFQAFLHEAEFPRQGPIVADLGQVASSVPRCVTSSPIELTRALNNPNGFYVAAHSEADDMVLRGQLQGAETVFDNRDADLVAAQLAAQEQSATDGDGLFGNPEDGAYLIVDAGKVTFVGAVPDQETAEQLLAAFIPLSGMGVEVVDNLTVQAGAPAPSGRVLVADELLFASNQDDITGDSDVLATVADLMSVNPTWTMTVTGHTDNVGDYLYNIELSLRRATSVRSHLVDLGVTEGRIGVQGAGAEQPIADNNTEAGRALNRRIEIRIDA